jgi:hypothetical protein
MHAKAEIKEEKGLIGIVETVPSFLFSKRYISLPDFPPLMTQNPTHTRALVASAKQVPPSPQ